MTPRLRLFTGEETESTTSRAPSAPGQVSVRLSEILEPLADACRSNRVFLKDFAQDEIQLSADLYDVLMSYRRMRASA